MKNFLALLVILGGLGATLFFSGNLPSCAFDPGPDRPGLFKPGPGWTALTSIAPAYGDGWVSGRVYRVEDFERSKYVSGPDLVLKSYPGREVTSLLGLSEHLVMTPLVEREIPKGGLFNTYPEEIRGKTFLGENSGGMFSEKMKFNPEVIEKRYGDKVTYTLKHYGLPVGRWAAQSPSGMYFIEIR